MPRSHPAGSDRTVKPCLSSSQTRPSHCRQPPPVPDPRRPDRDAQWRPERYRCRASSLPPVPSQGEYQPGHGAPKQHPRQGGKPVPRRARREQLDVAEPEPVSSAHPPIQRAYGCQASHGDYARERVIAQGFGLQPSRRRQSDHHQREGQRVRQPPDRQVDPGERQQPPPEYRPGRQQAGRSPRQQRQQRHRHQRRRKLDLQVHSIDRCPADAAPPAQKRETRDRDQLPRLQNLPAALTMRRRPDHALPA